MAPIIGSPIFPSGSGAGFVAVTATAASTVTQNGMALVSLGVTAGGGSGSYSYAWTLTDPRGVDRSVLLSSSTVAAPTFTPTDIGGAWTAVCVVTDGQGETARAVQRAVIGQSGFVLARSIVSDGATNESPAGSAIGWGGVTFAAPNAGVAVVDGDLVLTGQASTDLGRGGVSTRTAALVSVSLLTLAGLAALGDRQVLIVVDVESYAPYTTNEALRVGLEQASAPIGSGSGGRGVCGGHSYSTNLRASSVLRADGGGTGDDNATATTATIAGVGLIFASGAVRVYTATTAYADAAAVLADTAEQAGGMRASATMATMDQVVIAVAKPTAGGGAVCTIRGLQVWVR
jgi:hypothetical protein